MQELENFTQEKLARENIGCLALLLAIQNPIAYGYFRKLMESEKKFDPMEQVQMIGEMD